MIWLKLFSSVILFLLVSVSAMSLSQGEIKKTIRKIRFYQRFRFSESVKSASNFDADKTDLLRKNADKNRFDLH
ncbi:hypothetical protein [Flavobacterium pectinovorum]|uniref:GLPGLI family protein n=1 Tax=Flavobacterium pectinovorum TaxID=29533 RepID=A0ABY1IYY5_9FLAO|nr:hypothetical protein [Flavobacterium pectinovorum]SHL42391.1 hypothetical protein SAMN05444387_0573 [Flavobacterium pectinovorum]